MAKGVPAQVGKDKAKTKEVVSQAHDLIAEHYLELTQALIDKAVGMRFQDEKGNVYTKEPDTTALIRAIEILGGKPVARVETSEAGGFSEYEEWIKGQVAAVQSVPPPSEPAVKVLPPFDLVPLPLEDGLGGQLFWDGGELMQFDPVPPSEPSQRPSVPPPAEWKPYSPPATPTGKPFVDPKWAPLPGASALVPPKESLVPPPADVAGATGVEGARPPGKDAIEDILKDIGWGP